MTELEQMRVDNRGLRMVIHGMVAQQTKDKERIQALDMYIDAMEAALYSADEMRLAAKHTIDNHYHDGALEFACVAWDKLREKIGERP